MRTVLAALTMVVALAAPDFASAQSRTTLGVGSGAVAGALVGGPIGAVAGAVVGGFVGHASERGHRRVRRARRYGYAAQRRALPRRADAAAARVPGPVAQAAPAAPAPVATTWKDPH